MQHACPPPPPLLCLRGAASTDGCRVQLSCFAIGIARCVYGSSRRSTVCKIDVGPRPRRRCLTVAVTAGHRMPCGAYGQPTCVILVMKDESYDGCPANRADPNEATDGTSEERKGPCEQQQPLGRMLHLQRRSTNSRCEQRIATAQGLSARQPHLPGRDARASGAAPAQGPHPAYAETAPRRASCCGHTYGATVS